MLLVLDSQGPTVQWTMVMRLIVHGGADVTNCQPAAGTAPLTLQKANVIPIFIQFCSCSKCAKANTVFKWIPSPQPPTPPPPHTHTLQKRAPDGMYIYNLLFKLTCSRGEFNQHLSYILRYKRMFHFSCLILEALVKTRVFIYRCSGYIRIF